jgi:hypothetical protein
MEKYFKCICKNCGIEFIGIDGCINDFCDNCSIARELIFCKNLFEILTPNPS